ncbi:hypothetical protein ROZALSC1DRAFT_24624 [Rozella allomycis CSF55]|uniref:Uncharacterized protein n=1 Tax=Rozella allomycis (strain CSF55) TaxID=988480 RepID=A0A4P9YCI5_ROZAC|nr:hypothetical protein ROZALSC1DRAFT_24624 [Rozella allomycis CSF55]
MFQEKITAHNFQDKCSITQDLSENSVLVAIDGRGVYRYSVTLTLSINGVILVSLDSVTVESANLDKKPLSVLNTGDNLVLIIFSDEIALYNLKFEKLSSVAHQFSTIMYTSSIEGDILIGNKSEKSCDLLKFSVENYSIQKPKCFKLNASTRSIACKGNEVYALTLNSLKKYKMGADMIMIEEWKGSYDDVLIVDENCIILKQKDTFIGMDFIYKRKVDEIELEKVSGAYFVLNNKLICTVGGELVIIQLQILKPSLLSALGSMVKTPTITSCLIGDTEGTNAAEVYSILQPNAPLSKVEQVVSNPKFGEIIDVNVVSTLLNNLTISEKIPHKIMKHVMKTGLVTSWTCQDLLEKALKGKDWKLLISILKYVNDLTEEDLFKIIIAVLDSRNDSSLTKKKVDMIMSMAFSRSVSEASAVKSMRHLKEEHFDYLFQFLVNMMKQYSNSLDLKIVNYPSLDQITQWLTIIIDSHITDLILKEKYSKEIMNLLEVIYEEKKFCQSLLKFKGEIAHISKEYEKVVVIPNYSTEYIVL